MDKKYVNEKYSPHYEEEKKKAAETARLEEEKRKTAEAARLKEEKRKTDNNISLKQEIPKAGHIIENLFMLGCDQVNKRNFAEAYFMFLKAAEQGHVKSQYIVGLMYEKGEGIGRDEKKAIEWYKKAADRGHEEALNKLVRMRIY
ncbi:MAG: tetratricopeptide repeat protein [Bacillota bacterium]